MTFTKEIAAALIPGLLALASLAHAGEGRGEAGADSGRHWRLASPRGALHLWCPDSYAPADADLVLYVHGYYDEVDTAWERHHLQRQLQQSGRNALFVAVEAPSGPSQPVRWRGLEELLGWLSSQGPVPMPAGRVVAIGHSGAYRTLLGWLASPALDDVVLLDAVYCSLAPFQRWLDGKDRRRLLVIAHSTAARAERELAGSGAAWRTSVPSSIEELSDAERASRVLYWRSQFGHMAIVTGGRVLPLVLQWPDPPEPGSS